MNQTERELAAEERSSAPTTLHLFRYKGAELGALKTHADIALDFATTRNRISNSVSKLAVERNKRVVRLDQLSLELTKQTVNTVSYVSCGEAYLKMQDELPELSPQELMDFFKLCLKINTQIALTLPLNRHPQTNLLNTMVVLSSGQPIHERQGIMSEIIEKNSENPPKWFKDDKKYWKIFVAQHSIFCIYLNDELDKTIDIQRFTLKEYVDALNKHPGSTINGEYPDWLIESDSIVPAKEQVEEELQEDKSQLEQIREGLQRLVKQRIYLDESILEKITNASNRIAMSANEHLEEFKSFSDLILAIKAFSSNSRDQSQKGIVEDMIYRFTGNINVVSFQEPIALYIESKLREGNVIKSSQEIIVDNFIRIFTSAIRDIKASQNNDSPSEFEELKQTNHKAYDAIKHRIMHFLQILTQEDLTILEDLLTKDSKGKPVEIFIWDMASTISSRFKSQNIEDMSQRQRGALVYLIRFTASFLRNHAAYQRILKHDSNPMRLRSRSTL